MYWLGLSVQITCVVLQSWILALLWRRNLWRKFPIFTGYIAYVLVRTIIGSATLSKPNIYRIRLIREYLRRVAHNVEAIHLWIAGEYELIKDKDRSSYSEKDALVLEALQLTIDLRVYSLVARVKVWSWTVFRMYRWPTRLLPRVTDLRVQYGVNVLAKYRRLTEIAAALSLMQGKAYHDRLLEAL